MNEGDSAGGGHQGHSPAPPAVPVRRSTLSTSTKHTVPTLITSTHTAVSLATALNVPETTNTTATSVRSFQQVFTQQQLQLEQQQSLATFPSRSVVVSSLSATSNRQQYHMQHISPQYVAGVAASPTLPSTQSKQQRIIVTQAQLSHLDRVSTTDTRVLQAKRPKINAQVTENVVGTADHVAESLLPILSLTSDKRNAHTLAAQESSIQQDVNTLKKRILEYKLLLLKNIKERNSEHVAELFYLQSGGNMMDYPAWTKKPPSPKYINFCKAYRLDHVVAEDVATSSVAPVKSAAHVAGNIATVIGVSSSQSINNPHEPIDITNKTNIQVQLPPRTTALQGVKRKRSSSTPPNVTTQVAASTLVSVGQHSNFSQGAEINIPAVGATPVAVSTTLPAAVVQLTQQGGTPLIPCDNICGNAGLRRNRNDVTDDLSTSAIHAISTVSTTSLSMEQHPSASEIVRCANSAGHAASGCLNNAQEYSFKAKQEVFVLQRISELQREGLWTERRLPKLQEPSRPKAHWDYLLEEMVWLAADFAQERKWKKNAAKKCAKMVQKHFQEKSNAAQKAEKAQEMHLKRIAAFISKEIKLFWSNVEKLVEYKHHTKIEEKRKKALDQHLSFIVDQTEKFSQQLAEGMNKSVMENTIAVTITAPSINSDCISSLKREGTHVSDDEFRPVSSSEDDEETIAKAEEDAVDVNEEVAALERESQMNLDDFISDLPAGYLQTREKLVLDEKMVVCDGDETDVEFELNESSDDDENTISQQEAEESGLDYKQELDELQADNDLTVEQLMEKYKLKQSIEPSMNKSLEMEIDSDDELNFDDISDDSAEETENETIFSSDTDENDNEEGLESLLQDNDTNKDDIIKDAAALAESIQPKGNTLSSTNVVTPVPFLLKHSLREYQHIGLDWLVTMNDRKLNGILADEMGLGKTIQTIALLAHLACVKGNWGPHLIVVPSSVMLNWEMEFKKWCPGFKILTYYGTQKERKLKRVGWTKPNAFHVCITSYKLVVQDQQSFRRKKWKYLILDEAQNIKNFKSQRWQLLLNFSTERRLLLTGTPLQNDLMELWSLMHFLMPYVFSSHREFKEWFSNPMTGMIEGNMEYNESLINRLHKVIRPFLLRRLKKEVEKQMPKKYEHVVMCRLSNRQRYLYDDFMSRAKTKETLKTGNLLSVINILMQLRKVCNHPNMFEVRPTISPFQMEGISYETPRLICDLLDYNPFKHIDLCTFNLFLAQLELTLTAYVSYKSRLLAPLRKLIEEIDSIPEQPPRCPPGKYKFHIRIRDPKVQRDLSTHSSTSVQVGASPAMKTDGNKLVPIFITNKGSSRVTSRVNTIINPINTEKSMPATVNPRAVSTTNVTCTAHSTQQMYLGTKNFINTSSDAINTSATAATTAKIAKLVHSGKPYFLLTSAGSASGETGGGRLTLVCKAPTSVGITPAAKIEGVIPGDPKNTMLITALAQKLKSTTEAPGIKVATDVGKNKQVGNEDASSERETIYNTTELLQKRKEMRSANLKLLSFFNKRRIEAVPIYGSDCRHALEKCTAPIEEIQFSSWQTRGYTNCSTAMNHSDNWTLRKLLKSYEQRCEELRYTFANFVIYVPSVCAPRIRFYTHNMCSSRVQQQSVIEDVITREMSPKLALLHPIISAMNTQFPDPRLIQYDCGKLQTLDLLLRQLKSGQHRVLIFTQMTKMLDVLEAFLNFHGHIYLRLDGSTRVEQRQVLMERFNGDKRIFCFILSTRSGGVGINLTGADTVIFYDSDWNPTMDAQAQDRCHRIGQTRDVHIYRLVSEKTIEVNILKKANQKRMLSDMAIEGGNFTTSFLKSSTIKDLFNLEQDRNMDTTNYAKPEKLALTTEIETEKQSLRAFENALAAAEDEQDVQATKIAKAEVAADLAEFDENIPIDDVDNTNVMEMSKADLEVHNLVKQLSPIERYALRFVEETGAAWTAEQLRAAEEELEAQKREWEANRLAALLKEEEVLKQEAVSDELITYSRKDATNQVNNSSNKKFTSRIKKLSKSKKLTSNQKVITRCSTQNDVFKRRSSEKLSTRQILSLKQSKLSQKKSFCISTSNNKGIEEVLHKAGRISVEQERTRGLKPNRKTTRTSIASVSEDDNMTKDVPYLKHLPFNKLRDTVKSTIKSFTGVKNQKLLSISKKRKKLLKSYETNNTKRKCRQSSKVKVALRRSSLLGENPSHVLRNYSTKRRTKGTGKPELHGPSKTKHKNACVYKKTSSDDNAYEQLITNKSVNETETEQDTDKEILRNTYTKLNKDSNKKINKMASKFKANKNCEFDEHTTSANSDSVDDWNAHSQIQDTATTNSTYYNVSEETDSDDNENLVEHVNLTARNKSVTTATAAHSQRSLASVNATLAAPQQNYLDFNSPRTRSRGSVKINLWTLDVSPVLPGVKPQLPKTAKKDLYSKLENTHKKRDSTDDPLRNTSASEEDDDANQKHQVKSGLSSTPLKITSKKNLASTTKLQRRQYKSFHNSGHECKSKSTTTLQRWLLKTPKAAKSDSERSGTESPLSNTLLVANGPS